jgi:hypothetical protein
LSVLLRTIPTYKALAKQLTKSSFMSLCDDLGDWMSLVLILNADALFLSIEIGCGPQLEVTSPIAFKLLARSLN